MLSVMETWSTFAVITGGAAAALTGLLFVAVSIKIEVIAASAELRNRAAQTLGLFVTVLLTASLLAIPWQSEALGGELTALAVLAGAVLYVLDVRAKSEKSGQPVARVLDVAAPNLVTSLLLLSAALVLASGVHAGLYLLVAPILAALTGGVASAWLLLTKIKP